MAIIEQFALSDRFQAGKSISGVRTRWVFHSLNPWYSFVRNDVPCAYILCLYCRASTPKYDNPWCRYRNVSLNPISSVRGWRFQKCFGNLNFNVMFQALWIFCSLVTIASYDMAYCVRKDDHGMRYLACWAIRCACQPLGRTTLPTFANATFPNGKTNVSKVDSKWLHRKFQNLKLFSELLISSLSSSHKNGIPGPPPFKILYPYRWTSSIVTKI